MGTEIERKFLLRSDAWRAEADAGERLRQGYLAGDTRCSVRVRIAGERAELNIKGATVGASRAEYEYPLPLADAEEMLATLCRGPVLAKTRYRVPSGPHVWEIDVFEGDNAGLVVAEIELGAEHEDFERPVWLGQEVTGDRRYYNACLADHPYCRW